MAKYTEVTINAFTPVFSCFVAQRLSFLCAFFYTIKILIKRFV